MLKLVLLCLALSGLQAVPLGSPRGLDKSRSLPDGFRQGTEPSRRFLVDLNTGQVKEHISEMDRRAAFIRPSLGNGFGEMERRHWLTNEASVDVPAQRIGGGWVRVEEPSAPGLPDGFRQGTEPVITVPEGFRQGTEPYLRIPEGFRQGTEPVITVPEGFRQGTEPVINIPEGFRQGTEPVINIPEGFRQGTEPSLRIPEGFRQGTEPSLRIPEGFRQGTEPFLRIPDGFRQGTEPSLRIPQGFRQGTEPVITIREGFRQGTEPVITIPEGFRQGTEPVITIPEGFRQGTEPYLRIPEGFRQGTEPYLRIPEGFRQGTEPSTFRLPVGFRQGTDPSTSRLQAKTVACEGEIINGNCYQFNPSPLAFQDAQAFCKALGPNAELASVTNGDLHSRLVSLVTKGGTTSPVLTWLGGVVKNQQASWVDGSEWAYSDWMPGHPNIHTDKPVCLEMFKIDEGWWTAADCELKRASICSYPTAA